MRAEREGGGDEGVCWACLNMKVGRMQSSEGGKDGGCF